MMKFAAEKAELQRLKKLNRTATLERRKVIVYFKSIVRFIKNLRLL
jgi:hypothetical protein